MYRDSKEDKDVSIRGDVSFSAGNGLNGSLQIKLFKEDVEELGTLVFNFNTLFNVRADSYNLQLSFSSFNSSKYKLSKSTFPEGADFTQIVAETIDDILGVNTGSTYNADTKNKISEIEGKVIKLK